MGYKFTPRMRLDLSDLGDNNGNPFFVEIKNPRILTYERKVELAGVAKIEDETERAKAMKKVAQEFILAWNLIDIDTEAPVDPKAQDALDKVPSEVVESIFQSFGQKDDETKNSSEQSVKS